MPCTYCPHCEGLRVPPEVSAILAAVGHHFGVSVAAIRAKSKAFKPTRARFAAYRALRDVLRLSTPEIGFYCGKRDHSTVINGLRVAERRPMLAAEIETLIADIQAQPAREVAA